MRDNGGIKIDCVDFSTVKNYGIKWSFDRFGNPVPDAKDDELFKTYKIDDYLYFDIFTIIIDQDDLMLTTAFMFDVYKINKFETHGSVANKMAFTSPNDCLDAAIIWINENEKILEKYFNLNFNQDFHSSLEEEEIRIGEYHFHSDKSNIFDDSKIFIKHRHFNSKNI